MNTSITALFRRCTTAIRMTLAVIATLVPALHAGSQDTLALLRHDTVIAVFAEELQELGACKDALSDAQFILEDLRDFELYPVTLTRLSEDQLVAFDKKIETVEKRHRQLLKKLSAIRIQCMDAIGIQREMLIHETVAEMMATLRQKSVERMSRCTALRGDIIKLFEGVCAVWSAVDAYMGFAPLADNTGMPFAQHPDTFGNRLSDLIDECAMYSDTLKKLLIERGGDEDTRKMYSVESFRLKKLLKTGDKARIEEKLIAMRDRYTGRTILNEINRYIAQVQFEQGFYRASLNTLGQLTGQDTAEEFSIAYTVMNRYALGQFDTVWQWGKRHTFDSISEKNRNYLLWLVLESGIAIGSKEDFSKLASAIVPGASYSLHVMHALSRGYVLRDELSLAADVLKKALQHESSAAGRQDTIINRIRLTRAHVLFESGLYQQARESFFELLNEPGFFEEAMFGIAWCDIKSGSYTNAEIALKKLINQSPESRRAIESFFVTIKRFLSKAEMEWKKTQYLHKEGNKITDIMRRLEEKIALTADKDSLMLLKNVYNEIVSVHTRFKNEHAADYTEIQSYFVQSLKICGLIIDYYKTGKFQIARITHMQEHILHSIDSLFAVAHDDNAGRYRAATMTVERNAGVEQVKKMVGDSYSMLADIQLAFARWESEYFDWKKKVLYDSLIGVERNDSLTGGNNRPLKEKIRLRYDSLVALDESSQIVWGTELVALLQQLLSAKLDAADEAYFRYQLSELLYAEENRRFTGAYSLFEAASARYDSLQKASHYKGTVTAPRPVPPMISHDSSIAQLRIILLKYPADPLAATVHYSLAWCFNDRGTLDSAIKHMNIVASRYPESPYAPQAWMYIGEYHFDNFKLSEALEAYKAVLKYPESPWFEDALYKLAWTQYRLSNPEKAISSFIALIDLNDAGKMKKNLLLQEESLGYVAISFCESDMTGESGLQRAKAFCIKLADEEKGTKILEKVAQVYEHQGRFDLATKTYKAIIELYPRFSFNPLIESRMIKLMSKSTPVKEINNYKLSFYNKYNCKSAWARRQTDSTLVKTADSAAQFHLYDAALTYHQLALQYNDTALYGKALSAYRLFYNTYADAKAASECHYNYAEVLFTLGKYHEAAQEYMAVSRKYPGNKYTETAAWNAIVASQNMLKQEEKKKP